MFQVSFEHDKWLDVPVDENRHIEGSFCIPFNDSCFVHVGSILLCVCNLLLYLFCPVWI